MAKKKELDCKFDQSELFWPIRASSSLPAKTGTLQGHWRPGICFLSMGCLESENACWCSGNEKWNDPYKFINHPTGGFFFGDQSNWVHSSKNIVRGHLESSEPPAIGALLSRFFFGWEGYPTKIDKTEEKQKGIGRQLILSSKTGAPSHGLLFSSSPEPESLGNRPRRRQSTCLVGVAGCHGPPLD